MVAVGESSHPPPSDSTVLLAARGLGCLMDLRPFARADAEKNSALCFAGPLGLGQEAQETTGG